MEMIQNAMMFQDAAPVALPQSGRGTAAVRGTDGGGSASGSFADLLGKQASRDDAVTPADSQSAGTGASRHVAFLRPQNSSGTPASAAGAAQDPQAPPADPAEAQTAPAGQPGLGSVLRSLKWPNSQPQVAKDAGSTQQAAGTSAGASGAATAPDMAKGADRWKMLNDLQRNSLAAEAQETTAVSDAQQGRGVTVATAAEAKKVVLPVSGRAKESNQAEVRTLAARKSWAAEAQEAAPLTAAAQQGMAGMLLATAKDAPVFASGADAVLGNNGQGGMPPVARAVGNGAGVAAGELSAAHSAQAPLAGVGTTPAAGAAGALPGVEPGKGDAAALQAQKPVTGAVQQEAHLRVAAWQAAATQEMGKGAPQEEAAPKGAGATAAPPSSKVDAAQLNGQGSILVAQPAGNATAQVREPAPVGKSQNLDAGATLQAKPNPVAAGTQAGPAVVLQKGSGMDSAALDRLRETSPGAVTDGLQNADAKGEEVRPVTTGAPEKGQPVAAAADGTTPGPAIPGPVAATGPDQQGAVLQAAATDSTPLSDRFAQGGAEGSKGPRAAQGFHGTYGAARVAAEQNGAKTEAPAQDAGFKTASLSVAAKFALAQGSAGQDGSGDAGQKGNPEQKTQSAAGPAAQPQGVGLPAAANVEAPLPEAKPVNLKSALHESILSQIKDGVVTHDDKGNGQMSIRLNPGELGELKIQVRMDDNRLHVEVQADNKMVKDLLMSNLDSLKDSLTAKNFSMEGFDVSTGGGGSNNPLPEQKGNPQQQPLLRSARAGSYPDQGEQQGRVNYLTGEANNLLDVRF